MWGGLYALRSEDMTLSESLLSSSEICNVELGVVVACCDVDGNALRGNRFLLSDFTDSSRLVLLEEREIHFGTAGSSSLWDPREFSAVMLATFSCGWVVVVWVALVDELLVSVRREVWAGIVDIVLVCTEFLESQSDRSAVHVAVAKVSASVWVCWLQGSLFVWVAESDTQQYSVFVWAWTGCGWTLVWVDCCFVITLRSWVWEPTECALMSVWVVAQAVMIEVCFLRCIHWVSEKL